MQIDLTDSGRLCWLIAALSSASGDVFGVACQMAQVVRSSRLLEQATGRNTADSSVM